MNCGASELTVIRTICPRLLNWSYYCNPRTLLGLLSTYGRVGLLAPILLLACWLTQGVSAGGEFAGFNSFIMEYAPIERRGFWASISSASTVFPSVYGALVVLLLSSTLSEAAYGSWGWRLPFLLGGHSRSSACTSG